MIVYEPKEKFTINIGNNDKAYLNQIQFCNITKVESDGQLSLRLYNGETVIATVLTENLRVYVDEIKLNDLKLYNIWCGNITKNISKDNIAIQ